MKRRHAIGRLALLGLALLGWLLWQLVPSGGTSPAAQAQAAGGLYTVQQRFGVNLATSFTGIPDFPGSIADYPTVLDLGIGWYSDWQMRINPNTLGDRVQYAQVVPTRPWPPDWDFLERAVLANPGSIWMIGNEPETRYQGEHTPEEYAAIYHDAFAFIKGLDRNAQITIGGLVMPTPLRLEWLRRCRLYYRNTYGERLPVDLWNIHVQILQEKRNYWGCGVPTGLAPDEGRLYTVTDNCSVDIFKQLVLEFCRWLVDHGERDKPLVISEYGVLMPSSYLPQGDQSVINFMEGTFEFLMNTRDPTLGWWRDENRLVQRWMWFSLNFPSYDEVAGGFNGALYRWDNPTAITSFGRFYRNYVKRYTGSERLYLANLSKGWRASAPTATPSRTNTSTPAASPTATATPTSTITPSVTPTSTFTEAPTPTETVEPSQTPKPTPE